MSGLQTDLVVTIDHDGDYSIVVKGSRPSWIHEGPLPSELTEYHLPVGPHLVDRAVLQGLLIRVTKPRLGRITEVVTLTHSSTTPVGVIRDYLLQCYLGMKGLLTRDHLLYPLNAHPANLEWLADLIRERILWNESKGIKGLVGGFLMEHTGMPLNWQTAWEKLSNVPIEKSCISCKYWAYGEPIQCAVHPMEQRLPCNDHETR